MSLEQFLEAVRDKRISDETVADILAHMPELEKSYKEALELADKIKE